METRIVHIEDGHVQCMRKAVLEEKREGTVAGGGAKKEKPRTNAPTCTSAPK